MRARDRADDMLLALQAHLNPSIGGAAGGDALKYARRLASGSILAVGVALRNGL